MVPDFGKTRDEGYTIRLSDEVPACMRLWFPRYWVIQAQASRWAYTPLQGLACRKGQQPQWTKSVPGPGWP